MSDRLERFFASYGAYHDNIINKLIHICCIPMIFMSSQALLSHYQSTFVAQVLTGILGLGYMYIDLFSGFLSSMIYGSTMYYVGISGFSLQIWWYIHAASWVAQFVGHGIFEKRAPALLDNILLTLVAPNFVTLEILQFLGYKKQTFLNAQNLINENIRKHRESKKQKN